MEEWKMNLQLSGNICRPPPFRRLCCRGKFVLAGAPAVAYSFNLFHGWGWAPEVPTLWPGNNI